MLRKIIFKQILSNTVSYILYTTFIEMQQKIIF